MKRVNIRMNSDGMIEKVITELDPSCYYCVCLRNREQEQRLKEQNSQKCVGVENAQGTLSSSDDKVSQV